MDRKDFEELKKLRKDCKELNQINSHRFAWWVTQNKTELVVSILQAHIRKVDKEIAATPDKEKRGRK
jgi:hemerythrin